MSQSRDDILRTIRRSMGRGFIDGDRKAELQARLKSPPKGIIPQRSQLTHEEQLALFIRQAEGVQATVARVDDLASVPEAVTHYLSQHNLPARVKMPDHDLLKDLPWEKTPALTRLTGPTGGDDQVSLSVAFAAIAETGTLMLLSGPDGPTTLNFLPETHMVLLSEDMLVGAYEEAWDRLRDRQKKTGDSHLPRTVNMITGPSRTGDIEQTILLGAHGPHRLHILIVRESGPGNDKEEKG